MKSESVSVSVSVSVSEGVSESVSESVCVYVCVLMSKTAAAGPNTSKPTKTRTNALKARMFQPFA